MEIQSLEDKLNSAGDICVFINVSVSNYKYHGKEIRDQLIGKLIENGLWSKLNDN